MTTANQDLPERKAAPTPGPWSLAFGDVVRGADGTIIAEVHSSEADTDLIIAAPDLLAAVQPLLSRYLSLLRDAAANPLDVATYPEIINARKAIAKARGGAA